MLSCVHNGTQRPFMSRTYCLKTMGPQVRYRLPMNTSLLFERAFIALVSEMVEQKGLSHSDFGRLVFGETSGVRLWRWCRSNGGRTRRLMLGEAYAMADALGMDFPTLVWKLTKEIEEKGMMETDSPT